MEIMFTPIMNEVLLIVIAFIYVMWVILGWMPFENYFGGKLSKPTYVYKLIYLVNLAILIIGVVFCVLFGVGAIVVV